MKSGTTSGSRPAALLCPELIASLRRSMPGALPALPVSCDGRPASPVRQVPRVQTRVHADLRHPGTPSFPKPSRCRCRHAGAGSPTTAQGHAPPREPSRPSCSTSGLPRFAQGRVVEVRCDQVWLQIVAVGVQMLRVGRQLLQEPLGSLEQRPVPKPDTQLQVSLRTVRPVGTDQPPLPRAAGVIIPGQEQAEG